jgi:hypothetical protein
VKRSKDELPTSMRIIPVIRVAALSASDSPSESWRVGLSLLLPILAIPSVKKATESQSYSATQGFFHSETDRLMANCAVRCYVVTQKTSIRQI